MPDKRKNPFRKEAKNKLLNVGRKKVTYARNAKNQILVLRKINFFYWFFCCAIEYCKLFDV